MKRRKLFALTSAHGFFISAGWGLLAFLFSLIWTFSVAAQTAFYQGKTISMIVGNKAGDVYDLYARFLGHHMRMHILGNPNIITQNMPGAGSLIAANYVYNVSKPDGLTIGAIYPALYFDQVIGREEVKFNWSKFNWIGSPVTSNLLLYIRADTPYKTMDDVRNASEPPKCGATGSTSFAYYVPRLFEEVIGTKFNIVAGYGSGGDVDLAVERGEVICRAFSINAYFAREPFHTWRKKGFVRVIAQTGKKRDSRLADVPTIYELMDRYKSPDSARRLATLVLAAGDFGRPYVLPPGTPADRVKTLREAFTKIINDPSVIEDAQKRNLDIDPTSNEELTALAREVISQPPEVVERMRKMLGK
jgi:tripartite-type tricarboxylate transporter receptor subunit TctC